MRTMHEGCTQPLQGLTLLTMVICIADVRIELCELPDAQICKKDGAELSISHDLLAEIHTQFPEQACVYLGFGRLSHGADSIKSGCDRSQGLCHTH